MTSPSVLTTSSARHGLRRPVPAQAMGLALATLEALAARRPLHQLRPHLSGGAFASLVQYSDTNRYRDSHLGRIRGQMPSPTSAEVNASIRVGERWLACVLRVEYAGRWRVADLHVLGGPS